jgi:hypothetical protein
MKKNNIVRVGIFFAGFYSLFSESVCTASQVQAPSLKINGYTIVNAAMANQQRTDNGKGGTSPHIAIGSSDLYFTISGKASSGLVYKYRINFETVPGASMYVNRNYIEFEGDFGEIQIGNLKGPEDAMPQSGANLVGGAYGIDGTMGSIYNFSAGVISGVNFIGETGKATKVIFYSPTVMGFQLGVSFTPNTSHMGKEDRDNSVLGISPSTGNSKRIYYDKNNIPYGTRNVVVGLTYSGIADKWSWELAAVGMTEKSHLVLAGWQQQYPVRNANSYQLSAAMGYDQWKVAAGWIDNRKSRMPRQAIATAPASTTGSTNKTGAALGDTYLGNAGQAWNLGGSYTVGAYQFAAAYHNTYRKTDATNRANSDILVTTVDLSALPGLKFFGEVDFVKTRTNDKAVAIQQTFLDASGKGQKAIGNNSATLFMVGSKVSF